MFPAWKTNGFPLSSRKTGCAIFSPQPKISWLFKKPASVSDINTILAEILPAEALNQPVEEYSGGMKRRVAIAGRFWLFRHSCHG